MSRHVQIQIAAGMAMLLLICSARADSNASIQLLRNRSVLDRPTLLVVGSIHFDNPGKDVVNTKSADVTGPVRQKELQEVIRRLRAFHPTKIVVEWPLSDQMNLDARYAEYVAGRYKLGSSEVDQLGLRLAAAIHLPKVYAADWNEMPPGSIDEYDYEAYAANAGSEAQARLAAIRSRPADPSSRWVAYHTILDWFRYLNSPDTQERSNRAYFDYAMLSDGIKYPGPNWVGAWYARNLKVFTNVVRIASSPRDRILMIFGNGHAFLQKEFAAQSGAFQLAQAEDYLDK